MVTAQALDGLIQGGAGLLVTLFVISIMRGWLVPSRQVRAIEQDRDYWRAAALKSLGHTQQLMPVAEVVTQLAAEVATQVAPGGKGRG